MALLVFLVQFYTDVVPLIATCFASAQIQLFLPTAAMIAGGAVWIWRHRVSKRKYDEFLQNSPGKKIDTAGIEYGVGHPTKLSKS